jgi:UDP-galactopyranose mutase
LELREAGDDNYFKGQWQGVPKNGYSYLINRIVKDIPIKFNTSNFNPDAFDVVFYLDL